MPEEKKEKGEEAKAKESRHEKKEEPKPKQAGKLAREEAKPKQSEKPKEKVDEDFRHRVRVLRLVIDGNLNISRALMKIKGMGQQTSRAVVRELNIDRKTKLGSLTDKEIVRIENTIKELHTHMPGWMSNRQRDPHSGKDTHFVGPDLELKTREDIHLQMKMKSYRGVRHSAGLPVRGQRTRTSFRKGATIGVSRKKIQQKSAQKTEGGKK